MRWAAVLVLSLSALECKKENTEGGELEPSQCVDIVRKTNRLRSDDASTHLAARRAERATEETCLRNGTERAYRCVMQAQTAEDLAACDPLFR